MDIQIDSIQIKNTIESVLFTLIVSFYACLQQLNILQ